MPAYSQIVNSKNTLDFLFERNVKSIDEFCSRFNGFESHPDIPDDSLNRQNNILALFNPDIDTQGRTKEEFRNLITDFITEVINRQERINIDSENVFIEILCDFKYESNTFHATLLLRREKSEKGNPRWAIAGVKGLQSAGFYADRFAGISPVDHEMEFVGFSDLFNINKKLIASVKTQYRNIDELSMFIGLAQSRDFKFISSNKLRVHFLDIPGYVFSISQSNKKQDLGSWMIDRIDKAGDFNKLEYINALFGLK